MKKRRPSNESSEKAKIDLVKVAGEDLYHVDDELSPVAEEVDEEDWEEEGNESEEAEVNGPECWRCDGEYEPEGDPEERIDRVADEVEEKDFRKWKRQGNQKVAQKELATWQLAMCMTAEKKPYHHEDGTTTKGWKVTVEEKIKTSCKRIRFR